MSVPPEVAWLIPLLVPFIIGLLIGAIIKRTAKLLFAVAALIIVLIATGTVSMSSKDIYNSVMKYLPEAIEKGQSWLNLLPYSAPAFLIGLALGLWKG